MKTTTTIMVTSLLMVLTSATAMAATSGAKARELMREKNKTVATALSGAKTAPQVIVKAASTLSAVANGRADANSLSMAMRKNVTVKSANGDTSMSLKDVGTRLLRLDQSVKELRELRDLTADGKAHVDAIEKAVEVGAQFLALASRTSPSEAPYMPIKALKRAMPENQMVQALYKQLSILKEIGTMETADIIAHTKVMEAAVKEATSPNEFGDQVFKKALMKSVGNDQKRFDQKLKELLGCV